ncbi:hypothetical protein HY311_00020 [Candidatus Nomurabacteria bacterium]|nr:hypothetical protein [Candidatus Nomurabacteria bacterium]
MFGENKNLNLKDSALLPPPAKGRAREGSVSVIGYSKTNKLITALYMVTDIMDKDEPLRNKLRTLGTGIISDISLIESNYIGHVSALVQKISEIMSFLDIASAVNIISQMNTNILKKEFAELDKSIKESMGENEITHREIDIGEFLHDSPLEEYPLPRGRWTIHPVSQASHPSRGEALSKGHNLGVQKGSTLLKALSDRINPEVKSHGAVSHDVFDALKKQRREEITNIIQKNNKSATITDIKNGAYGTLVSCGEKTLQRELISMVKDGVLNKTGEKRWSRYFIK